MSRSRINLVTMFSSAVLLLSTVMPMTMTVQAASRPAVSDIHQLKRTPATAEQESNSVEFSTQELQNELINKLNPYIVIENGRYVIKNEQQVRLLLEQFVQSHPQLKMSSDQAYASVMSNIRMLNKYASRNLLRAAGNKGFVATYTDRSSRSQKRYFHWWGTTTVFYTDAAAHRYAYQLHQYAAANDIVAAIEMLLPGADALSIETVIGARLDDMIANSVDYNASLRGHGAVLNITYLGAYTCSPRR